MKYKVITIPSSEDSDKIEEMNLETYSDAEKAMGELHSASIHEFETEAEAEAFVKGFDAGMGWLGDGFFAANYKDETANVNVIPTQKLFNVLDFNENVRLAKVTRAEANKFMKDNKSGPWLLEEIN